MKQDTSAHGVKPEVLSHFIMIKDKMSPAQPQTGCSILGKFKKSK